jgi:hypothetical protein
MLNAGFEDGFSSGVANYWVKFNYAGNVTCSDGTSQKRTGAHSQQIDTPNSGSEGGVYQQFDALPGVQYQVKVWMKVSSGDGYAYLGVDPYGGTDSHSGNIAWNGTQSTSWALQTWTGTAQGSVGKITVYLDMSSINSTSQTGWYDDASPACDSVPSIPTDGTPLALSTTSIRWIWNDVANETGYRVKNTGGTNLSGDLAANTTQWDETTGIAANTQYTRRIYAFNAYGESAGSTGQSRYSLIQIPTGVTFGTVTPTSIIATPSGTLSNLTAGGSGVRTSNTTAGTDSGWQTSQSAWTSSGLVANTQYGFVARARNGDGVETGNCPVAAKLTLSNPPGSDSITPSSASTCTNQNIVWTAAGGFGPGKIQYYLYAWDQNPTHTWTGSEPLWPNDTITTSAASTGTWYLHVKGYNGADVANGTYDYAVTIRNYVRADFNQDCAVDLADCYLLVSCASGMDVPYAYGCSGKDLDTDGDVDQSDFGLLQRCMGGPGAPVEPTCAP